MARAEFVCQERSGEPEGGSASRSRTVGGHQSLTPVYSNFEELAARTYYAFDEQRTLWAQRIRQLKRGRCLLRLVDADRLRTIDVRRSAPGHLKFDMDQIARLVPSAIDAMRRLVEENSARAEFVSVDVVDREAEARLRGFLGPSTMPIQLALPASSTSSDADDVPFA